jgi:4-diphosphocytidyl-2-methyl-D-erithritol synthase
MNSVIILAAGISNRFNAILPKQFVLLYKNKTVLDFSVEAFKKNKFIDEIIIVVHNNWEKKIKAKYKNCKVISGGESRSESSLIGLNQCTSSVKKVLIHDAARPFVSQNIINQCIKKLDLNDAVIPILHNVDSLIEIAENKINYLNRDAIKIVQTPQAFQYHKIVSSYETKSTSTDDLSILLKNNKTAKCCFIDGEKNNFKITNKNDILFAKKYFNEI